MSTDILSRCREIVRQWGGAKWEMVQYGKPYHNRMGWMSLDQYARYLQKAGTKGLSTPSIVFEACKGVVATT
jgi:hypothetical protein